MSEKKKLVDLLENHDWYYDRSDDHRAQKAGMYSYELIQDAIQKIGKEEGIKIFNEHCPPGKELDVERYHC